MSEYLQFAIWAGISLVVGHLIRPRDVRKWLGIIAFVAAWVLAFFRQLNWRASILASSVYVSVLLGSIFSFVEIDSQSRLVMFCSRVRLLDLGARHYWLLLSAPKSKLLTLNIRTWDFINYFSGIAVIYEEVES